MPLVDVITSVELKGEALRSFSLEFSKVIADMLGANLAQVAIHYTYDPNLIMGGSFEPAFILRVASLTGISRQHNPESSKVLFSFFKERLGAPAERGIIAFTTPDPHNIGLLGTTVPHLK